MTILNLNLGSGNKPLGRPWVNVDKYVILPGDYDYIQNDVQTLEDVQPESVDKILASHIIEHIHPSEVKQTLDRWFEVLKPGGCIALEQPNLIKCAINLLQAVTQKPDDALGSVQGQLWHQYGMFGFYGNSKNKNDGMFHYWGYWPESLSLLLDRSGFISIQEEVPEIKLWGAHIRDFRLVARKPVRLSL